ncbi:hypothetical protein FRC10_011750 [Ceratobasidium sp. 414]|nr:hypothetical protein FRC10_011750 [Ceratobasidium sp. 414]
MKDRFLTRIVNVPGIEHFKGAVIAMLNKSGSVMSEVISLMGSAGKTLAHAWRDQVYRKPQPTRSKPSNTDKELEEIFNANKQSLDFTPLFYDEALSRLSDMVDPAYSVMVDCLLRRAWERLQRWTKKALETGVKKSGWYANALTAAQHDPTPQGLQDTAYFFKEWKSYTTITGEIMEPVFQQQECDMDKLWEDLGFTHGTGGAEMEAVYWDYLSKFDLENEECAIVELTNTIQGLNKDKDNANTDLLQMISGEDLSVTEFSNTPIEELFCLLGLESVEGTKTLPMASENMMMQWHQLIDITTMLKWMFTP